jgi:hypothetical protein
MNWPKQPLTAQVSEWVDQPLTTGSAERRPGYRKRRTKIEKTQEGTAMLDIIGESAVRTTARPDTNHIVGNGDITLNKARQRIQERPVENTHESNRPESEAESEKGRFNVDEGGLFFEKYDKKGNLIFRLPPEQKPIDEHI